MFFPCVPYSFSQNAVFKKLDRFSLLHDGNVLSVPRVKTAFLVKTERRGPW